MTTATQPLPALPPELEGWRWDYSDYAHEWRLIHPEGSSKWDTKGYRMPDKAIAEAKRYVLSQPKPKPIVASAALSPELQDCARRYVAAQQRSGEALLDACRALAEARALAQHGEWGRFLEATRTSESAAKRLLDIHTAAEADPAYREAVRSNWIGATVAAEIAGPSFPAEARAQLLSGPEPPTKADVRAAKSATVADLERDANGKFMPAVAAQFEDARRRFAALGWKLERHGVWFKLSKPDGSHYATTETLDPQLNTLEHFEAGARRRAHEAAEQKPNIPEVAPAIPDDIRQAAGRLELLIERRGNEVVLFWPEERAKVQSGGGDSIEPMSFAEAREWLANDAPGIALERLDKTIPPALQKAGYYWQSALPPTIAHNAPDEWTGDAPTVAGALALAQDRLVAKAAPPEPQQPLTPTATPPEWAERAAQLLAVVDHNPEVQPVGTFPFWKDVALALDIVWDAVDRQDRPKAVELLLYALVDVLGYRELPTLAKAWAAVGRLLASEVDDLAEIAGEVDDATYEALARLQREPAGVPTLESEGL